MRDDAASPANSARAAVIGVLRCALWPVVSTYEGVMFVKGLYDGLGTPEGTGSVYAMGGVAIATRYAGRVATLGIRAAEARGLAMTRWLGSGNAAATGAHRAIGSTGQIGQEWLASNLGGQSQVYFNTSQGGRYIDQLANGIANESKVGYQSLSRSISLQISKDAELLNNGVVEGVDWHFFQSPVTGLGGPSQPLFNALQHNGITVIIH